MSPLGEDEYVADLAEEFGFPLVVVSRNVLGTINQTLQTLIAAAVFREGLPIAGVVLNRISHHTGKTDNGVFGGADIPVCQKRHVFLGRQECLPRRGEKCGLNHPSPPQPHAEREEYVTSSPPQPHAEREEYVTPAPANADPSLAGNRAELAARCTRPILAEVLWNAAGFDAPVDWFSLAR